MKRLLFIFTLFATGCTFAQQQVRFTNLGDALKNPANTRELIFNGHPLGQLPDTLFSLYQLETLDLCNCSLSVLPDKIGKLKNLKSLRLNFNQLTSLPESIGELVQLEELYLNSNLLAALPASTCKLKNLRTLTIDDNLLTAVPQCLEDFERLDYFTLRNNKLSTEPDHVGPMEFRYSDTVWSADQSRAVFLATSKGLVRNTYGFYLHQYEIRLFDTELAVSTTLVRSKENSGSPEEMLTNFQNFFFSPDNKYVYFIVGSAWEKTDALHRVNTLTLKEHFVVDAFSYIVIDKGAHKGDLMVSRLYYSDGGPGANYWLISGDGKSRKELSNDEAVQFQR